MIIVGVTGYKGSGKSEVARILVNRHGFTRMRFAERLKLACKAMGASHAEVDGGLKEAPSAMLGGKTWRWAMQSLGTEWGRKLLCDDFWVRQWKDAVAKLDPKAVYGVVVDDVRFPNEVDAVHELGGVVWRVDRPGNGPKCPRLARVFPWLLHESERYVASLKVDAEITNDYSLALLASHTNAHLSCAFSSKYGALKRA